MSDDEIDLTDIMYNDKPKIDDKPNKKEIKQDIKPLKIPKTKIQPNTEENVKKIKIILLLKMYLVEFPDKLQIFKKTNFQSKTYDELIDIKKQMDCTISSRSTVKQGKLLVDTGLQSLEFVLLSFTPIKCDGLHNLSNDPEFSEDVKHMIIKYTQFIETEPEHRVMYKILSTILQLHSINSYKEQITTHNDNIINKVNVEYNDI